MRSPTSMPDLHAGCIILLRRDSRGLDSARLSCHGHRYTFSFTMVAAGILSGIRASHKRRTLARLLYFTQKPSVGRYMCDVRLSCFLKASARLDLSTYSRYATGSRQITMVRLVVWMSKLTHDDGR